jgi:hypothetical protein
VQFVDPAKGAIQFRRFKTAKTRIVYSMPQHRGEYALFTDDAVRAEIAFIAAIGDFVSLDYPARLRAMIESWHFNITRSVSYGEDGNIVTGFSNYHILHYRLGQSHNCVGFEYGWDSPGTDPDSKPGKLVIGYFCSTQKQPLSRKQLIRLFDGLDVAETAAVTQRSLRGTKPGIDPKAMKAGLGDGKNWGNRDFPFAFGSEYDENTGDG